MALRTFRSLIFILFGVLATSAFCAGQPGRAVRFFQQNRVFRIDAGEATYAFGVNEKNELQSIYWGGRLRDDDTIPSPKAAHEVVSFDSPSTTTLQEFSGWGAGIYVEPALKVTFFDGNRDLVLHYVSQTTSKDGFVVVLKDISRDILVELHYTVDEATGILGRSAIITNRTKQPLTIEQAAAASWNLPSGADYYLSGRWAAEDSLNQQKIRPGKAVLESRRGSTGHQNNPWFAIERGSSTDEDTGEVWFGALAWSGSWSISIEQDQLRRFVSPGGYNPFDFSYRLAPGEQLSTPVFNGGYSHQGIGGASRALHRFELTRILSQAPKTRPRPIIYNSWEATGFDVNEDGQEALAEKQQALVSNASSWMMAGSDNEKTTMLDKWTPDDSP